MEDRADAIRRRIALYRRYLAEGVDTALAEAYTTYIVAGEAELAKLDKERDKRR